MSPSSKETSSLQTEFFNQYDSFPWKAVGDRACGPTVAAMAINTISKRRGSNTRTSPQAVLFEAGHMTRLPMDIPQYYLKVLGAKDNGMADYVPIGNKLDKHLKPEIENDPNLEVYQVQDTMHLEVSMDAGNYHPVYTLSGWDHRGSERFFATHNLTARQFGNKHEEKFNLRLMQSLVENGSLLMASTENVEDSSHLVLISEYSEENGGMFLISDPKKQGAEWVDATSWWENSFRGYGTVIYNSSTEEHG